RDFSISAPLAASTLTPAMMAPLVSLTTPEIVLCADANDSNSARTTTPAKACATNLALVITLLLANAALLSIQNQNSSFSANWSCRDVVAVWVITPAEGLLSMPEKTI